MTKSQQRANSRGEIISVRDKIITLENERGIKLVIEKDEEGFWNLGTFYLKEILLGNPIPYFLREDNVWENWREPFSNKYFPGNKWSPFYKASKYEIVENSGKRGIIKFYESGYTHMEFSVTIIMENSYSYQFEYEIKPIIPIKHELFVSLPFPKNLVFMQYPYETPITRGFNDIWTLYPKFSFLPFLFGCGEIDNKEVFVGIGYHLEQEDLTNGKLQYNPIQSPNYPLRIYFPYRHFGVYQWHWAQWGSSRAQSYKLRFVFSTAFNQTDCIKSYREVCGYNTSLPFPPKEIKKCVDAAMQGYRRTKAFVEVPPFEGKAYYMRVKVEKDKSEPYLFEEGYGKYIQPGGNMHLGYQLYRYYKVNPDQLWAKEYAIQIAKFFADVVRKENALPLVWDPEDKKFCSLNPQLTEKGFIYTTWSQAVGSIYLYKLAEDLEKEEEKDYSEWKNLSVKLTKDLANKVIKYGRLAREYDKNGNEGMLTTPGWPLIALDYFSEKTGENIFEEAREKLERWAYQGFIRINHYYGASDDNGAIKSPHPFNNDTFDLPTLAYYYMVRYLKTKDEKKLCIATDIINYYWLCCVPFQFQNYRNITKGLALEQDAYMVYDVPFRGNAFLAALPELSKITGDNFYEDFFNMLIQTNLYYQLPLDYEFPSFNIGLAPSPDMYKPTDLIAEPFSNFILLFFTFFFEALYLSHKYGWEGK